MSNPNEWVWLTHPELGDSPNPVQRSAAPHWFRLGWAETSAPAAEPAELTEPAATDQPAEPGEKGPESGLTANVSATGTRSRRPEAAANPAAATEIKE